jgi:hypothetical protein
MLNLKQCDTVRKAADLIASGESAFSCSAIMRAQGGQDLKNTYATFYGFEPHIWRWGELPEYAGGNTPQTQMQRELMLELFALTRGKL